MLAQAHVQHFARHIRVHRHAIVQPTHLNIPHKLWPGQYHSCCNRLKCRSVNPGQPDEADKSSSLKADTSSSSDIQRDTSSSKSAVQAPQQQQDVRQDAQQPVQQESAVPASQPAASIPPQPQPQQQQQQQVVVSSQRASTQPSRAQPSKPKASSSKSNTSSSKSSSSKPQARKQQQRPFFLFSWFNTAVAALKRMPSTLTTFLLGGLFSAFLLYSWALGSPLKRSHPYKFTMVFNEASKVDTGTPVRMKGVQIGNVVAATLYAAHVDVVAEVADASNIIPQGSRVDINLLGIAADPWIDITPPVNPVVRKDHGPHHPACVSEGLIVCHNGSIRGQLGGSTDFMMKFFLSQHDRTRVKVVDAIYHGKHV